MWMRPVSASSTTNSAANAMRCVGFKNFQPGAWVVETPFLPLTPVPNGMGDVFSAVFLAGLLRGAALPQALEHATSALYGLVKRVEPGARDLPLVAAQEEIVHPAEAFAARAV